MKKLLLILLCLPVFGFGQACHYESTIDASELCAFYRGNSFATNRNADIALDKILSVTGLAKRFVLMECNDIANCVATTYKGVRYILYDTDFMDAIATRTSSWSNLSILAHEIGHHINGHSLDLIVYASEAKEEPTLSELRQMELEADEYSGFVMYKLGASLIEAQEAVRLVSTNTNDSYSTHPSRDKRLAAITKGYNSAKNTDSNNDKYSISSNTTPELDSAEVYFYKAHYSTDNWVSLLNYEKCHYWLLTSKVEPSNQHYAALYNNKAQVYFKLEEYKKAIDNLTEAIEIDPLYAPQYKNLGDVYAEIGNNKDAIEEYSNAIKLDPEYSTAFMSRGLQYQELEQHRNAIEDYKRYIKLIPDDYKNQAFGHFSIAFAEVTLDKKFGGATSCYHLGKACQLDQQGQDKACYLYYKYCR